ncbi:hypothetical protein M2146_001126 [Lachnospiraceae bacterium PF1-22]
MRKNTSNLHYYELCFYHDEDDMLATEDRCSFCIKTEIPPTLSNEVALKILFPDKNLNERDARLQENLTRVMEIPEDEALSFYDVKGLTERVSSEYGVYYKRQYQELVQLV